VDRAFEPLDVAVLAEAGRDHVPDNLAGHGVGDHRLQPVADLQADLPVPQEDQQDDAVVEAFLPDPPALGEPDRVVLQALAFERAEQRDRHLGSGGPLPLGQERLQTRPLGGGEQAGVVVDAGGRRRRDGERGGEDDGEEQARTSPGAAWPRPAWPRRRPWA
jgi:hypothetical protein